MNGLRTQRYKLDVDDILTPPFLNAANSNKVLTGLNLYGSTVLLPKIGGLGTPGSAFSDGQFPIWNAAAGRFLNTNLAWNMLTGTPTATKLVYLPYPVLIPSAAVAVDLHGGTPATPASVSATVSGGVVTALNILNAGYGYVTPPTINFTTLGAGSGAAATATINGSGQVTGFTGLTGGSGYVGYVPVTVSFSGGDGSGAAAISGISLNAAQTGTGLALSEIYVTKGGTGYNSPPTVTITGGQGTGATATAIMSAGAVTGVQITNGGSGYYEATTRHYLGDTQTISGWRSVDLTSGAFAGLIPAGATGVIVRCKYYLPEAADGAGAFSFSFQSRANASAFPQVLAEDMFQHDNSGIGSTVGGGSGFAVVPIDATLKFDRRVVGYMSDVGYVTIAAYVVGYTIS